MLESRELCDLLGNRRNSSFLQRNNIGIGCLDYFGDLFSPSDSTLANVVRKESHRSLVFFFLFLVPVFALVEKHYVRLVHHYIAHELYERCRRLKIHRPACHPAQPLA